MPHLFHNPDDSCFFCLCPIPATLPPNPICPPPTGEALTLIVMKFTKNTTPNLQLAPNKKTADQIRGCQPGSRLAFPTFQRCQHSTVSMHLRWKHLRRSFMRKTRSELRAYLEQTCKWQMAKKIQPARQIQFHGHGSAWNPALGRAKARSLSHSCPDKPANPSNESLCFAL